VETPGVAAERERHRETKDEFEPRANGFRRARDGRHDGERQELQQKARQHRVIAADRILIAPKVSIGSRTECGTSLKTACQVADASELSK